MKDPISEVQALTKAVEQLGAKAEKTMNILTGNMGGSAKMNILGSALGTIGGVAGGLAGMLPNTMQTLTRAGGYYNASVAMGGVNRMRMEKATFSALNGGLSSVGIDAMVASTLSTMGVNFSSNASSHYMRVVRAAGNATKYLNMDTNVAATAIAGMNTGAMSATLMRNFGISTSDRNGNPLTQGQIFEQLAQRMTAGRGKASTKDTLNSLYQGALGASIQASGLSQDQQGMFAQYMIERSKGNYMDLSDPATMDKLKANMTAKGNENPFAAGYSINSSTTGAQMKSENSYISGLKVAADNIAALNTAAGELGNAFGGLKTWAEAIAGTTVGQGALGAGGSLVSGALDIGSNLMLLKALKGGGGLGPLGKSGFVGMMGEGTSLLGKIGKASPIISGVVGGVEMLGDVASGKGWGTKKFSSDMGQTIGSVAGGALGLFGGPMGAMVGSLLGGLAGQAIGGMFGTGGTSSNIALGTTAGSGALQLMTPTSGKITAYFGEKGGMWGSDGHHGIDYGVPAGTPVVAAAAGKVSYNDSQALGNVIRIDHGNGYATQYAHLSNKVVSSGSEVKQGDLIAYSGATGTQLTGAHLHFELWQGGGRVNPAPFLGIGFTSAALSASTWGAQSSSIFAPGTAPAPSLVTVTASGVKGTGSVGEAVSVRSTSSAAVASNSSSTATSGVGGRIAGRSMGVYLIKQLMILLYILNRLKHQLQYVVTLRTLS